MFCNLCLINYGQNSIVVLVPDLFKNVAPSKPVFAGFGPSTPAPIFGAKIVEKDPDTKIIGEPSAKKSAFERGGNIFGQKNSDREQESVPLSPKASGFGKAPPNIFGAKVERGSSEGDQKSASNIFGDSGKKIVFESTPSASNIFAVKSDGNTKPNLFGSDEPSKRSGNVFGRTLNTNNLFSGATSEAKLFGKSGWNICGLFKSSFQFELQECHLVLGTDVIAVFCCHKRLTLFNFLQSS